MDTLHGGYHTQLTEAGDIRGMEMLGVLDSPALVFLFRIFFKRSLIDVQSFMIASIADGMYTELKVILDGNSGGLCDFLDGRGIQTSAAGQVFVGFQKPGSMSTQCTIDQAFDGTHSQMVVSHAHDLVFRETSLQFLITFADHNIQSNT